MDVAVTDSDSRVRLAARLSSGCVVGVRTCTLTDDPMPASLIPAFHAGTIPARTMDDFPLPDAP